MAPLGFGCRGHGVAGAFYRPHDGHVRATTALHIGESLLDLGIAGLGRFLQQGHAVHDPAVRAVTALRSLFVHKGFLHRVHLAIFGQAIQGTNRFTHHRAGRRDTRTHCLAIH